MPKVEELLDLKERFGMGADPRRTQGGEMCVNPAFGSGGAQQTAKPISHNVDPALVSAITEEVIKALQNR